jgi:hypothetical protein
LPLFALVTAHRVAWRLNGRLQSLDTDLRKAVTSWAHLGVNCRCFSTWQWTDRAGRGIAPLIAGVVFRLLGVNSPLAESCLGVVATALVPNREFARLKTPALN